ncbi:MAG: hypothetical protein OEM38_07495 [Gammaproteobacteria bacterium]|nr:hypothetical protein [Gammaproteobacteria bacterium]
MNETTEFSPAVLQLPYYGEISSGKCLDKSKEKSKINIPAYLNVNAKCFVLKMKGDSMQENGLFHNDLLVIEPHNTSANNCIVIATIDNVDTVIKHFEQTNDLIILSCKNPDIKPMIFDPSRIKLMGILVAQMRSY